MPLLTPRSLARRSAFLPLVLVSIAGCSSARHTVPLVASSPAPVAPASRAETTPSFSLVISPRTASSHRSVKPDFVSAATRSVTITLVSSGGAAPVTSPASVTTTITPPCTATQPCTVLGPPALRGVTNVFSLTTFDQQGNALDGATASLSIPLISASVQTAAVTLLGIPSIVTIAGPPQYFAAGTPSQSAALGVTVADADGQTISGTYFNPVRITDPDTQASGSALSGTHAGTGCVGTCVDLTSATDTVTLSYGGLLEGPATIASSGTGLSSAGTATFVPVDYAHRLYVTTASYSTSGYNYAIAVYQAAVGTAGPWTRFATINDPSLVNPQAITTDSAGNVYVANYGGSISVFAPNVSGTSTATPIATIAGSQTGLSYPDGIALDSNGKIYVANFGSSSILVFPPHPSGLMNEAPIATIGGGTTGFSRPEDVAVGPDGRVYELDFNQSMNVFAANPSGSVSTAPLQSIAGNGNTTKLFIPQGLAVDGSGRPTSRAKISISASSPPTRPDKSRRSRTSSTDPSIIRRRSPSIPPATFISSTESDLAEISRSWRRTHRAGESVRRRSEESPGSRHRTVLLCADRRTLRVARPRLRHRADRDRRAIRARGRRRSVSPSA